MGAPSDELTLEIRQLTPRDTDRLATFFVTLVADARAAGWFHPHPFTVEQARWVCEDSGSRKDVYYAAFVDEQVVGYAMLRGWDEGYKTPAFGIAVISECRGRGIGHALAEYGITLCRQRNAPRLMLKCHKDNVAARNLYDALGFVFGESDETETQDIGYLDLA